MADRKRRALSKLPAPDDDIPGEAHLTQSAEPPRYLADSPGDDGPDNPVDMAGAETFSLRPDVWDDQSG
ncbi:MAG: hypothetical protein K0R39_3971 [Symbiobacteriaceae bacterium]|jgi:hypothetical protein|nr:hypothetical protein [Symbiobacteriaceae bacterium]